LNPDLLRIDINNDRAVNPDKGEVGVVSRIVVLLPGQANAERNETGLISEVSGETTPEGDDLVTTLHLASLTILIEVGPDVLAAEIVALRCGASSNFNGVLMGEVSEVRGSLVQATKHRELARAGSAVEEHKSLGVIVGSEELSEDESVNIRDINRGVGDLAEGFVVDTR
jgi:hypothetical protein